MASVEPRTAQKHPRMWVIVALIVCAIVGGVFYVQHQNAEIGNRAIAEFICSQNYTRYTTEWQNCVDDR